VTRSISNLPAALNPLVPIYTPGFREAL